MDPLDFENSRGIPSLQIAGLSVWIDKRGCLENYDHDKKVVIFIECSTSQSKTAFQHDFFVSVLMRRFIDFQKDCISLNNGQSKKAILDILDLSDSFKPSAHVEIGVPDRLGHMWAKIELDISSDNSSNHSRELEEWTVDHNFGFWIDQSYLP
jgi:hypothetical protein